MLSFIAARRSLVCALVLSTVGCATATAKAPAAAPAATPEASAAPQAPAAQAAASAVTPQPEAPQSEASKPTIPSSPDALEPPDGKWLVDEQGREYFTQEIPRIENQYRWVDDTHKQAQFAYGLILDVVTYDENKLVVKIYRPL